MKMFVGADALGGSGTVVTKFDDLAAKDSDHEWYGTCANVRRDCHSWDTALGLGYFSWKWGEEASDGMLLSKFTVLFTSRRLLSTDSSSKEFGCWRLI